MSGVAPSIEAVTSPHSLAGPRLVRLGLVLLLAVLLQTTLMVGLRVADGVPDLVAVVVAAAGALRGPLVGGATGFLGGLAVELTSPTGTVGVLALSLLVCGAWCGRAAIEPRAGFLAPIGVTRLLLGLVLVQVGVAVLNYLLGNGLPLTQAVPRVMLPALVLSALIAPPVIVLLRQMLAGPRVVEPAGGR